MAHLWPVLRGSKLQSPWLQVLVKYNVVFQYLLRLKRIQVDLEGAWRVMRRQAGRPRDLPQQTRHLPLWHLRHHMAYIISNLQIYVQVSRNTYILTSIGCLHVQAAVMYPAAVIDPRSRSLISA